MPKYLTFPAEIEKLFVALLIPRKMVTALMACYLVATMSIIGYIGIYILSQVFSSFG
jgi:hypothetical protein